jgi:hypothetical protein
MLDQASFKALGLSDAYLTGIEWAGAGRDLCITLTPASGPPVKIICTWVHSRRIGLETLHGGHPLTWETTLVPEGDQWRLKLDFASEGSIELRCNGVLLGPQA